MRPYKLLLLTYTHARNLAVSKSSNQMIGTMLKTEFEKLEHVDFAHKITAEFKESDLQGVDFVLVHSYLGDKDLQRLVSLRNKHGYRIAWAQSLPYQHADFSFTWPNYGKHSINIPNPCSKAIYEQFTVPKIPKTILLDHAWIPHLGTEKEWTARIIEWLSLLKDEYEICKISVPLESDLVYPAWVKRLELLPYLEYLEATRHFETFVVTHLGSYNHSIVDVAGRGIRVLSPPNFTRKGMSDIFGVCIFNDGQGLRSEIQKPVDENRVNSQINKCTDMVDAVAKMDSVFQEKINAD